MAMTTRWELVITAEAEVIPGEPPVDSAPETEDGDD